MKLLFEELDYQSTPLGDISLRRRADPRLDGLVIYEVLLGEEFLMSSLFTEAEIQLARLALAGRAPDSVDVIVGGLGLGYTAAAALQEDCVRSLRVIEVMDAVIGWHRQGLVPVGTALAEDSRCQLLQGDFFELAMADARGFGNLGNKVDAVLLDIDHSPTHWLHEDNRRFYTGESLEALANKIRPGGVFALWSNDPPDMEFVALLDSVFSGTAYHEVRFANPYTGGESANTVYISHSRNA